MDKTNCGRKNLIILLGSNSTSFTFVGFGHYYIVDFRLLYTHVNRDMNLTTTTTNVCPLVSQSVNIM